MQVKCLPTVTLTQAGTAYPLATGPTFAYWFVMQLRPDATGPIYWGDSTVTNGTTTNGIKLQIGDTNLSSHPSGMTASKIPELVDLSQIYVVSDTGGDHVNVVYGAQ